MNVSLDTQQRDAVERIGAWVARERALRALDGAGESDPSSTPSQRVAPDGSHTKYCYDTLRRLTAVHHADGTATRYRYGDNDRLVEIDSSSAPRRFEHDGLGRLVVEHRGNAGAVLYRYDDDGRVLEFRTARVSVVQGFDSQGRITKLVQTIDGVSLEVELDFDANGRLCDLRIHDARVHYTWDARGRPAAVAVNGYEAARFEYLDSERLCRIRSANGIVEESRADPVDARPRSRCWARDGESIERLDYLYDEAGRLESDGRLVYTYDAKGWLVAARDPGSGQIFSYVYDRAGNRLAGSPAIEPREYRFNQAGELVEVRMRGDCVARFIYDAKGRLTLAQTGDAVERYLYGPADELLAIAGGDGRLSRVFVRTPLGLAAELADGTLRYVHHDERGTRLFLSDAHGAVLGRDALDPFGLPLQETGPAPMFGTRFWHPRVRLYYFGARWYDPSLGRFLTPDTYTGGPDDARIVNALGSSRAQELARECLLGRWLVRSHNLYAFCGNDPINAIDPNGHWAFGRVLLSLLGAIWTLPNTVFGLLIEITCLVGEVVRWIVYAVTAGHVSWATPGFDAAASGRLNAFALVFRGGWLGSFSSLLGITFGNVFFVYDRWEESNAIAPGGDVSPAAYGGTETLPLHDALYEHELRHTNQYGWFGPFFHLGLPLFGVYEWDVILHGYRESALEEDAREHGGI